MNKTIKYGLACAALAVSSLYSAEGWLTDYEAAKKQAVEEKKLLLLEFTGSDWCPPCQLLSREVFSKKEFVEKAQEKYVLVELDYPQQKEQADELVAQNQKLLEKHKVEGYPTVIILNTEEKEIGRTGYHEGGPEEYLTHLVSVVDNKKKNEEAFAAARKLEGIEKAKALLAAYEALPEEELEAHQGVIDEIIAADPNDETGVAKELAMMEEVGKLNEQLSKLSEKEDFDAMSTLVEGFITEHKPEGEFLQMALYFRAFVQLEKGEFDKVMGTIDEAVAADPDSEFGANAELIKQQISAEIEARKEEKASKEAEEAEEAEEEKPEDKKAA